MTTGSEPGDGPEARPLSRRATVVQQVKRLISAIRNNDETKVENAVLALSQRSRWLAPLALVVGAFAMLFQGLKLLVTNWRLTLVEILPAMWIWAAMLDLKLHVFRGKEFHIIRGPLLIPILLAVASITAASFFLNAVFAFAIAKPGTPQIRPAFSQAREHLRPILSWGFTIGVALWFAAIIVQRWGKGWYAVTLSIVVAVMMFSYVAVPSRLVGIKSARSRRDKLTATAVGGAIGGVVCSPPYALGRVAILLLGSHTFRVLAVIMLAVAVVLQTGATTATKAIKFSAKLVVSHKAPGSDEAAGDTDEAAAAEATTAGAADVADSAAVQSVGPAVPAVASDEG
ncbi:MAG: hypothetical protein ABSF33_15670 [Acidimicrobiales bacterium]